MMVLIFLLLLIAMLSAFLGKKAVGYAFFASSVIIGLYWFNHHATDPLSILL
ncbi:DUF5993 family protein [Vibrio campbellii]|uniref:DUF5993 family protein n=1 Tax=Vibrio campbellii TaxID=680 RepID=UPI001D177C08|nr:DUF5993 family protein [Vibrio campbellii]MCC4222661.1 DUF5993 family protein [Vibrio campbellii]